jgi:hypothetical protein
MKKDNRIEIGDLVMFQAYEDSIPIIGKVLRKGTMKQLQRGFTSSSSEEDSRIFFELIRVEEDRDNSIFTLTTSKWITKIIDF